MLGTKLSVEQAVFNLLMYSVMLIGSLAAITVDALGMMVDNRLYFYNLMIVPGTMAAGALCHFFLHRSASYITTPKGFNDNSDCVALKDYEVGIKNHSNTKLFVGVMNLIILSIITTLEIRAVVLFEPSNPMTYLSASIFGAALMYFCIAPVMAKSGWKE